MPSYTLVDEPDSFDIGEWQAHLRHLRALARERPDDEGVAGAIEHAIRTIRLLRGLKRGRTGKAVV